MNDWDRDNLQFLVNCNSEEFKRWMNMMEEDDLFYALELIRSAKDELVLEELALKDSLVDYADGDFAEAKAVLSRFTLKANRGSI